jgi:hypothetical protein
MLFGKIKCESVLGIKNEGSGKHSKHLRSEWQEDWAGHWKMGLVALSQTCFVIFAWLMPPPRNWVSSSIQQGDELHHEDVFLLEQSTLTPLSAAKATITIMLHYTNCAMAWLGLLRQNTTDQGLKQIFFPLHFCRLGIPGSGCWQIPSLVTTLVPRL